MGEKIIVGPFTKGLKTDRDPFYIDNDNFPQIINAYQWRGRVKRKRGTAPLIRLQRFFDSSNTAYGSTATITLSGAGAGNLITGFSLQSTAAIIPGTVTITAPGPTLYTDPAQDGTLSPSGSINYATGAITILAEAGNAVSAKFRYYPALPVMGLEEFNTTTSSTPANIFFDTKYSYNVTGAIPYSCYDVSFYKNPAVDATNLPGYVPKTIETPLTWNGGDYQQFWTANYQGALWATNGVSVPFVTTNIGMQYKAITGVAIITAGNGTTIPAVADLTIVAHGLVQGDFIYVNEVQGITGINFQTGYVTSADPQAANLVRVTFPFAVLGGAYTSGGIAQYLTNRSDPTKDCIRFYDGDPTNGNATAPVLSGTKGWVNFCPPISQSNFSIADLPAAQYYLVGAKMIVNFKDRLLFLGPVVQTSAADSQVYLQDTIVYSQNGTPYYTSSFDGSASGAPTSATTVFHPVLLPVNQTATAPAYFSDSTGFGGWISAGIDEVLSTVSSNEDVLVTGFTETQAKLVYTGNDIIPFNFYIINSELGSSSTFSSINMDRGVMTRGPRGYVITSQVEAQRFDLDIPDFVFQIRLKDNGNERVCAQRDFINEWVYFTYPSNQSSYKFPTETLFYNYRDNTWAVFKESFTTYGQFKTSTGLTWGTVGNFFPTWGQWNQPWNASQSSILQPDVIAGNSQGFVVIRAEGTGEADTGYVQAVTGSVITSTNHCLANGDYITFSNCLGTISSQLNGKVFKVSNATANQFTLNPPIATGTYFGNGTIKRMYVPFIQTKQFPVSWGMGRKTRLGVQQYLFTTTDDSQVTLLIYLSQNADSPYNQSPIIPSINSINDSLIYSTILYTCPESTNLGLTAPNANLQMVTAEEQAQIWHRINTSLLGDTVQVAVTLSHEQMTTFEPTVNKFNITAATQAYPCVLDCIVDSTVNVGSMVQISEVQGMTELNNDTSKPNPVYRVIAISATTVSLDVDSTAFTAYSSGGVLTVMSLNNPTAEIELHGMILDVSPSMILA